MTLLQLGLFSWILTGVAVGLLALRALPGSPSLRLAPTLVAGLAGALLGGLLATALGFGGLTGYDLRSLITAALAALLAVTWLRIASLAV